MKRERVRKMLWGLVESLIAFFIAYVIWKLFFLGHFDNY